MKKKYLFSSNMVFQNLSSPEIPGNNGKETLDKLSSTIEDSYKQQLLMMHQLNETVAPVNEELNRHNQIIAEMQKHFAENPQLEEYSRIEGVSGEEIITIMTKDGTYQEYLDDQPINFLQWLLDKAKKNKTN